MTIARRNYLIDYQEKRINKFIDIMFYFYIVRCSDNSLYCGQTNNLQRRIKEHNVDKNKSAKYLRAKKPVKLVYFEEYSTLKEAMKRECQIKKWTKAKKETLISMTFRERVYQITKQIPKGKVVTYGQIARLAGNPKASRAV